MNGTTGRPQPIFYVLGNGPSLTTRIVQSLPDGAWLGMNSAFRYWHTIGKYPRYYACLDPVVVKSQFDGIQELLDLEEIEAFFLHDCVVDLDTRLSSHPKVTLLSRFLARTDLAVPMSRLAVEKQTTGALATRFVIEQGHRDLMLIGIDCKYVERLAESAQTQGIELVITKKVQNNPNYFFSGYQATGDKYQVPNPAIHTGNLHLQSFISLRQDLEDAGVRARITVGAQRSLLSRFCVFPTASIWQALGIRRIGAVAVPLTPREWRRQIENLSLWLDPKLRPSLGSGHQATVLHLFFSGLTDNALERDLREAISAISELQEYFAEVRITFLGIPAEIDHYVRSTAGSDEPCTKSGPNVFFLATMAHCKEYEYVLHAETDCLPVRAGWLDAADGEIDRAGTQAWIIGPAYFHASQLHSAYRLHINGNAIYQTGDPDFQQFLQSTFFEALTHLIRSGFRDMAYDTALSVLTYNLHALPPALHHELMLALPRFAFSHFIRNVGGAAETAKPNLVNVRAILDESDSTYMMHGRPGFHHLDGDRSFLPSMFCRSQWQPREEMPLFWAGGASAGMCVTALGYGDVEFRSVTQSFPDRLCLSLHHIRLTTDAGRRTFRASFVWPGGDLLDIQLAFMLRSAAGESRQLSASGWSKHSVDTGTRIDTWLDNVEVADAVTVGVVVANLPYAGETGRITRARMDEVRNHSGHSAMVPFPVHTIPPSEAAYDAIQRWHSFYSGLPRVTASLQPYWIHWESKHFLSRNVSLKPGIVDMTLSCGGLPENVASPVFVCVIAALNWRHASRFMLTVRIPRPISGEAVFRLCRHGQAPWEYRDVSVALHAGLGMATVDGPLFTQEHPAYRLELIRCVPVEGQFTMQVVVEWPELPDSLNVTTPIGTAVPRSEPARRWEPRAAAHPPRVLIIDPTLAGSPSATGQLKNLFFRDRPSDTLAQVWEPFAQDGRLAFTAMINSSQRTLHGPDDLLERCRQFDPDVVYVRPDDNLGFIEATVQLCKGLARPVVLHIMDDWMERSRTRNLNRWKALTNALCTLIERASVHLSICPTMSLMLRARFGKNWHVLANGVPASAVALQDTTPDAQNVFVVRYMGGLAKDMSLQSVRLMAQAVERLSERLPLRFEIHTMDWYLAEGRELFSALKSTSVHPLVGSESYDGTLRSSGALLIAYNFDAESIAYTRYSFSNKLPECLASGRPVILIGPPEVATVKEIGQAPGVICVDRPDFDEISRRLEDVVCSESLRRQLAEDALGLVRERFLGDKVVARMREFIDVAAQAGNSHDVKPILSPGISFAEANKLLRGGRDLEAFRGYAELIAERDLSVYYDNARLCLHRLQLDEGSLEHAIAAAVFRRSS